MRDLFTYSTKTNFCYRFATMDRQLKPRTALLFALLCLSLSEAFLSKTMSLNVKLSDSINTRSGVTDLAAKRKRRRRKDVPGENALGDDSIPTFDADSPDELPEFELIEEMDEQPVKKKVVLDPDVITPAMMGNVNQPVGSIKDLIGDRSLESKFEFEEPDDTSLPDLVELSRQDAGMGETDGMGKKKARQAQRKAAAIAAKGGDVEEPGFFSELPFISDTPDNLQAIKTGAWGGIFLLVGWEIYLNSPFFDRAAPLAPVVFENLTL